MGFPIQRKGWLTLAAAVGLLCAAAPSLGAQGGTIRGTVVEPATASRWRARRWRAAAAAR